MRLNLHEWGDPSAPRLVCLHGITGHGGRFRKLAEERLVERFHVLAPDLRGHGHSGWEPPWRIETHLEDVLETVGEEPATWLGHSFGGRLVLELAAREHDLVERAVLLDPALQLLPHVGLNMAEEERESVAFATMADAVQARIDSGRVLHTPYELLEQEMRDHLERGRDGLLRLRYCKSAVVAAYGELALPPDFAAARVPTLVVLGAQSWLVLEEHLDAYGEALGELLEVVTVPGGHSVLWDAFARTADLVEAFLSRHTSDTHAREFRR